MSDAPSEPSWGTSQVESRIVANKPLAPYTSLKVGGPADYFAEAHDAQEMAGLLAWASAQHLPCRVIGGGSNLLVADAGVDGLIVKLRGGRGSVVQAPEGPRLIADSDVSLANIARRLSKQGCGGLEWATNVPGTVGGAAVNNAGAFGGDMAGSVLSTTIIDAGGWARRLTPGELGYRYRTSALKRGEMGSVAVARVELRLHVMDPAASQAQVAAYQAQRARSQPRQLSAGSVFANPPGQFAGQLIESVGLKGLRVGGSQISVQHANFIVNTQGATADDVYALMQQAQETVRGRLGAHLQPEIELVGRWTASQRKALTSAQGVWRADGLRPAMHDRAL